MLRARARGELGTLGATCNAAADGGSFCTRHQPAGKPGGQRGFALNEPFVPEPS